MTTQSSLNFDFKNGFSKITLQAKFEQRRSCSKTKQQAKFAVVSNIKEYKKLLKESLKKLDSDSNNKDDEPTSFTEENENDCFDII